MAETLIDVKDLHVSFATERGMVKAVDGVTFDVARGEVLAIVGESGSGKSVTVGTLMGLTRSPNSRITGSAMFNGTDLIKASESTMQRIRGAEIAMIFQDPLTSLDPVYRVGDQIVEQIRAHDKKISRGAAFSRAVELMKRVGIPRAEERARSYPHEFSGGMRQRVVIAIALSCSPQLLIADEPTTALDVTIQAQIIREFKSLREETGAGVIMVTHDLGVVADVADRIAVMYGGRIVEEGTLEELFYDPQHPYTWGLLGSIARVDRDRPDRLPAIPGLPPSLLSPPEGCHFRPRCPHAFSKCKEVPPLEERIGVPGHSDRCWLTPEQKKELRVVNGQIGLAATGTGAGKVPDSGEPLPMADTDSEQPSRVEVKRRAAEEKEPAAGTASSNGSGALLEVQHLVHHFPVRGGVLFDHNIDVVHAIDDVSFVVEQGETLGLVGESGCGKTTLARCIVRLIQPTDGRIIFNGNDITSAGRKQLKPLRKRLQMVFQDPQASLNPRKRVGQIVGSPLQLQKEKQSLISKRVREILALVGLNPEHIDRFPHEFSGGQRQRIGVARALIVEPKLIVLDEPVSALDVSIQAQVINLLDDLQDEFGLSYIFVAHDLSVVRHVSDKIAVMYLGKVMELSPAEELYTKPIHPYTNALLSAIPIPDPRENKERERIVVKGEPPNPISPPSGCRFHTRCPYATDICKTVEPPLVTYPNGHLAACHHPLSVSEAEIKAATKSDLSPRSSGEELPDLQSLAADLR